MDESASILFGVRYLIHGLFDENGLPKRVHVTSTDNSLRLILNEYILNEQGSMLILDAKESNEGFVIYPLEWKGKIERTKKAFKSLEELKFLLDVNAVFGVWGRKQLEFFLDVLPRVIDVSSHFMEVSLLEESLVNRLSNEPPLTIGKVFRNLAFPFKKRLNMSIKSPEKDIMSFKMWVEETAWPVLLTCQNESISRLNDRIDDKNDLSDDSDEDGDNHEDDDELDYNETYDGYDERLKRLTKDKDYHYRKW